MSKPSIPAVAAAIAYEELSGKKHGWADPGELWGDIAEEFRRDYRAMARAALRAAGIEI